MPFDYEEPIDDVERNKVAHQIEKTARFQHLTGQRRESFVDGLSLCNTCKWAQSRRRASHNNKRMECQMFSGPCPEDISECTEYTTINSLSLNQMAEIAILIDVQPKGKKVGFHHDK
jgi:hypothetical protein